MKRSILVLLACLALAAPAGAVSPSPAPPAATVTGIPLDAPWKVAVYQLARSFKHPAWGWQHGERNYDLAMQLAKGDGLTVDTDVLFAACMLHDMAAFKPYEGPGEHGDVAATKSESVLRDAGFPMEKFPKVAAAMRGHMYYSNPGPGTEAILLHDADSLDFLGAIGAVRMISLTGESAASAAQSIAALRGFIKAIPPKLITETAQRIGAQRVRELQAFLDAYQRESFGGELP
jgi:uncharacterized protein